MSSLITPEATISYPNLFTPRTQKNAKPGAEPDYSCTLLFTEDAVKSADFQSILEAVMSLGKEKMGDRFEVAAKEGKIKLPFRRDIESSGFPSIYNLYIRTKSKQRPGIVDRFEDPRNPGKPVPITDPALIYAGAKVRATIGLYWYDQEGNKGIGVGLRNVQKLGDGDRIDGRRNAEDEFGALEKPKVADIGAMTPTEGASGGGTTKPSDVKSSLAGLLG